MQFADCHTAQSLQHIFIPAYSQSDLGKTHSESSGERVGILVQLGFSFERKKSLFLTLKCI